MDSQVYKDMLDVMTKRGGSYAKLDIPEFYALVQELFAPEEAELNNALPRNPVTAAEIAKEKGKSEAGVAALLEGMATYINKYDPVCVGTCFCRHEAKLRGEDLHGMPVETCMWFGERAEFAAERLGGRRVSKEEAMEILDRVEEAGLVHMSRNTTEEIDFLCNCDRWHCGVIQLVLKQPKPGLPEPPETMKDLVTAIKASTVRP